MLNIVFMGTPDFARESLKAIYEAGHNILAVVTNPDKPKGRGMKLIPSPVKEFAIEKNLKIYQPLKVRNNEDFIGEIKSLNPDVICVVAYGKILPKELLDIPKMGCINVHGSLLPKYRGAAPIQWSVLNGDKETGITTMYMDVGMDTGDMILKEKVKIGIAPREKQGEDFNLAPMLSKDMAKINWEEMNAEKIKNLVRGLNPIMGAYSELEGKKVKFWKVNVVNLKDLSQKFPELKEYEYRMNGLAPGTVLFADEKNGLYINAIDGIIKVLEIQGENAKKMLINDYLRGNKIQAGTIFE